MKDEPSSLLNISRRAHDQDPTAEEIMDHLLFSNNKPISEHRYLYVSVGTTRWGMNVHIRYHRRALRFTIGWILSWWELCLDSIVRKR